MFLPWIVDLVPLLKKEYLLIQNKNAPYEDKVTTLDGFWAFQNVFKILRSSVIGAKYPMWFPRSCISNPFEVRAFGHAAIPALLIRKWIGLPDNLNAAVNSEVSTKPGRCFPCPFDRQAIVTIAPCLAKDLAASRPKPQLEPATMK